MQLCVARCRSYSQLLHSLPPHAASRRASAAGSRHTQPAAAPTAVAAADQRWRAPAAGSRHMQPAAAAPAGAAPAAADQRPVLLLDVMDTLVTDPFFEAMPRFFNITFKELLAAKHPTAWVEFENDAISEEQLLAKFFADGRQFDGAALVQHMVDHYEYIDGIPQLLGRLKQAGYEMHAMSNYPKWYLRIEGKLQLSQYLDWTFVSCTGPMRGLRKPAPAAFEAVTRTLQVPPSRCLFVDDRQPNVDAAAAAGFHALKFDGCARQLEQELRQLGLEF